MILRTGIHQAVGLCFQNFLAIVILYDIECDLPESMPIVRKQLNIRSIQIASFKFIDSTRSNSPLFIFKYCSFLDIYIIFISVLVSKILRDL